jgi:hypothetical protein
LWIHLHHGDYTPHEVHWTDFDDDGKADLSFRAGSEDVASTYVFVDRMTKSGFGLTQCDPVDSCLDRGGGYDYQFAACDMERAHPGPNSACLRDLAGNWVVVGHRAPGISAMSEADADSWNGSAVTLSRNAFTFRDRVCSTPAFATKEIPRPEFAETFRVSGEALGLADKQICVTEVSCAGGSPGPGSLLIHGRGELLALWDGVYFRLHRQ